MDTSSDIVPNRHNNNDNNLESVILVVLIPEPQRAPAERVFVPSTCQVARQKALGPSVMGALGMYVPQCNPDGSFSSSQCHISSGYCWCVDKHGHEQQESRKRGKAECKVKGTDLMQNGGC